MRNTARGAQTLSSVKHYGSRRSTFSKFTAGYTITSRLPYVVQVFMSATSRTVAHQHSPSLLTDIQPSMSQNRWIEKRSSTLTTKEGIVHLFLWPKYTTIPEEDRKYWNLKASYVRFNYSKVRDNTKSYLHQFVKVILTVRRGGCATSLQDFWKANHEPFHVEARSSDPVDAAFIALKYILQEYGFLRSMQPRRGLMEKDRSRQGPLKTACLQWNFNQQALHA
jgi:hypothetical protein